MGALHSQLGAAAHKKTDKNFSILPLHEWRHALVAFMRLPVSFVQLYVLTSAPEICSMCRCYD